MTESKQTFATKCLEKTYNAFLFAPLSEDRSAEPLSVVSALSRLGVDPWEEAAELSRMNPKSASDRMAALLARLPGHEQAMPNLQATAARLVELIPRTTVFAESPRGGPNSLFSALSPPVAAVSFSLGCLVLIIGLLLAHGPSSAPAAGRGVAQSSTAPQLDRPTAATPR